MSSSESEFDEYAEHYGRALERGISVSGEDKNFFARGRIHWLKKRLDSIPYTPQAIMDYGCGTGSAAPFLHELLAPRRVLGVDVSEKSLDVARKTHAQNGTEFALIRDCAPRGDIDLAFCNGVFHHIPSGQQAHSVQYIWSSLRPGGYFALWENNPWNPGARWVMKRIPFDRDAVMLWPAQTRVLMAASGFEIVRTDFLFIFPAFLRFLRGLEPALARLPFGAQYLVLGRKPAAGS